MGVDAGAWIEASNEVTARKLVSRMRQAVASGEEHWLLALLTTIRYWPLASEQVGDRRYSYLIGGEAFDWLLLAERLCDELQGLVPQEESEDLLFHEWLPLDMTEDEFRGLLGASKYRAHLNFMYGVRVEEALQLAVQEEVYKERLSRIWENGHVDDEACSRIYGATRRDLFATFRLENHLEAAEITSIAQLKEFTYWLFRYRLKQADPARVASDTRKGLGLLRQLEARRQQFRDLRYDMRSEARRPMG